jgi:hypothetical protein
MGRRKERTGADRPAFLGTAGRSELGFAMLGPSLSGTRMSAPGGATSKRRTSSRDEWDEEEDEPGSDEGPAPPSNLEVAATVFDGLMTARAGIFASPSSGSGQVASIGPTTPRQPPPIFRSTVSSNGRPHRNGQPLRRERAQARLPRRDRAPSPRSRNASRGAELLPLLAGGVPALEAEIARRGVPEEIIRP